MKPYIIARLTSPIGMTPSFSPDFRVEKRLNASLISFSSAPVMLCSLANLDCRVLGAAPPAGSAWAGARRFAGCHDDKIQSAHKP